MVPQVFIKGNTIIDIRKRLPGNSIVLPFDPEAEIFPLLPLLRSPRMSADSRDYCLRLVYLYCGALAYVVGTNLVWSIIHPGEL